jgi:peroxiredoxin
VADPQVGEQAPDFTLPISRNERMTLSEQLARGPVVLLFYVLDFTGG